MKKLLIILTLITIYSTGCKKGLDPTFYGNPTPSIFPSNEQEYELYTLEVYEPFTLRWGYTDGIWQYSFFGPEEGNIQMCDAPSDFMTTFPDWGNGGVYWDNKNQGDFAPLVGAGRDRSHFEKIRFITRITKIIEDLEKATVLKDQDFKHKLIAEAKMSRGWTMLLLLQYFGPVPVILDPAKIGDPVAEGDLTRPPRADFVNSIISDLSYAADSLPQEAASSDYGRFTKGMAMTVLMRLYMTEKDFVHAETVGREIQALGIYGLVTDYTSLFTESSERNSETIWAVSCDGASQGRGTDGNFNPFRMYVAPSNYIANPGAPGSWGFVFAATWDFYNSFDPSDARRSLLIPSYFTVDPISGDTTYYNEANGNLKGAIINKYPPSNNNSFQGNDFIVTRYADVLLMLAEAINENNSGPTQEAIDLVNEVRTRAVIADLSAGDIASHDAFNDAILRERSWELYFEGLRVPDLVRHGKWPAMVAAVTGKNPGPSLFPIPQYAVDKGCEQNSGY
jgi:hypothetical protein